MSEGEAVERAEGKPTGRRLVRRARRTSKFSGKYEAGQIVLHARIRKGEQDARVPGTLIGYLYIEDDGIRRRGVLSGGVFRVPGGKDVVLGIIARDQRVFTVDGTTLRLVETITLTAAAPDWPTDAARRHAWARSVRALVAEHFRPDPATLHYEAMAERYRATVAGFVRARIIDAGAAGHSRSASDFARAACTTWVPEDMVDPPRPTMHHALLVTMALGLGVKAGVQLIHVAGLHELRLPLLDTVVAKHIYDRTVEMLHAAYPAWWRDGYLCKWEHMSVESVMQDQLARWYEHETRPEILPDCRPPPLKGRNVSA